MIPQVVVNNGIMLYSEIEKGRCNPLQRPFPLTSELTGSTVATFEEHTHDALHSTIIPLPLPIQSTPAKVRAYGLKDAHSYPLVSMGKGRDGAHRGIVSCSSRGCLGLS